MVDALPAAALQLILEILFKSSEGSIDLASARLVCQRWADVSTAALAGLTPKTLVGLPAGLRKFRSVQSLDLKYLRSPLSTDDVAALAQLQHLRQVNLQNSSSHCSVSGNGIGSMNTSSPLLSALTSCTGLTQLVLGCATDAWVGQLPGLARLQALSLSGRLSDQGLRHLASLQQLKWLSLSCCDAISDAGLTVLTLLTGLACLQLHSCLQLGDAALVLIGQLTQLTQLCLPHSAEDATGRGLMGLMGLTGLRHLNLSATAEAADPAALSQLLSWRGMSHLTLLDVSYCTAVNGSVLRSITGLQQLRVLNLSGLNPPALRSLSSLRHMQQLQQLQLRWVGLLKDRQLSFLPHLSALTALDLAYCRSLTSEGLSHLLWLTQLVQLNLLSTGSSRDDDLPYLQGLKQLTGLTVSQLSGHSTAWKHLASLSQLRSLALRRCQFKAESSFAQTRHTIGSNRPHAACAASQSGQKCPCDSTSNCCFKASSDSSGGNSSYNSSTYLSACSRPGSSSGGSSSSSSSGGNEGAASAAPKVVATAAEGCRQFGSCACLSSLCCLTALDCSGSTIVSVDALRVLRRLPQLQHLGLARCAGVTDAVLDVLTWSTGLHKLDLRLRGAGSNWSCQGLLRLLQALADVAAVYVSQLPADLPPTEQYRVLTCSSEQVPLPVARDIGHEQGLTAGGDVF